MYINSIYSLIFIINILVLVLLQTYILSSQAEEALLSEQDQKPSIPRCPETFDKENPKDNAREKEIFQDMLKAAETDTTIRNLLIQSGKVDLPSLRISSTKASTDTIYTIPILFHMFTNVENGNVVGIVPDAAFQKQIEVMNAAFKNANLQFTLQEVKTYSNSAWFRNCDTDTDNMKKATGTLNEKYFNVWVCDSDPGYLGVATFPWYYDEDSKLHGVVLHYKTLPSVSGYTTIPEYNEGDTLTHEAGHFFGLYHTFQGGCNGGDEVSDTAAEATPAFGKPCNNATPRDTCPTLPGVDPVSNYMDYSDDSCLTQFSSLQYARMKTMFLKYKKTMANGGVAPTQAPTKPTATCPPTAPLFCSQSRKKKFCCPYGPNSSTAVCCVADAKCACSQTGFCPYKNQCCTATYPLMCTGSNKKQYCCKYGDGGSTEVCCPETNSCAVAGACCPKSAPLVCEGSGRKFCCPFGNGGSTAVCCASSCSSDGTCRVGSGLIAKIDSLFGATTPQPATIKIKDSSQSALRADENQGNAGLFGLNALIGSRGDGRGDNAEKLEIGPTN